MTTKRRRDEDGFILIESMAVLVLSALVLLTILIASDLVIQNSGAAVRRAHEIETLATGFAALRRDLADAQPVRAAVPPGGDPEAPATILFQGGATTIGLATEGEGSEAYDDRLVLIQATEEQGRGRLVRSTARLLPQIAGFDSAPFGNSAIVMAGPWSFRFAYAAEGEGALQWTDSWTNPRALPAAIRVAVLGKDDDPIAPPLVVKLHIDAEVECDQSKEGACKDKGEDQNQDQSGGEETNGGSNQGQ